MNEYWNKSKNDFVGPGKDFSFMGPKNTRDDYYKPKATGGIMGWGMSYKQFKAAETKDFAKRSAFFLNPLNAATREDTLNTLGMLSKSQKAQVAKGGIVNKAFHMAIPGVTAFGVGSTLAEGGDFSDYMTDIMAPEVGMFYGWRAGKSMGHTMGSMVSGKSAKSAGFKAMSGILGGAVGAVTGALAFGAAASGIKSSNDSNNFIKRSAHDIKGLDLTSDFLVNQNTMKQTTQRRRALDQLSKSSLNNRGQLMGNEAMIMRGVM